jgi:hypothetical protein
VSWHQGVVRGDCPLRAYQRVQSRRAPMACHGVLRSELSPFRVTVAPGCVLAWTSRRELCRPDIGKHQRGSPMTERAPVTEELPMAIDDRRRAPDGYQ